MDLDLEKLKILVPFHFLFGEIKLFIFHHGSSGSSLGFFV